jgi:hypothetical protein
MKAAVEQPIPERHRAGVTGVEVEGVDLSERDIDGN